MDLGGYKTNTIDDSLEQIEARANNVIGEYLSNVRKTMAAEKQELVNKLEEEKRDNVLLKAKAVELQSKIAKLTEEKRDSEILNAEMEKLKVQIDKMASERAENEIKMAELSAENGNLRAEKREIESEKAANEELKFKIDKLRSENETLLAEKTNFEVGEEAKYNELQSNLRQLKSDLGKVQGEKDHLEAVFTKLSVAYKIVEANNKELKSKVGDLESKSKEVKSECDEMTSPPVAVSTPKKKGEIREGIDDESADEPSKGERSSAIAVNKSSFSTQTDDGIGTVCGRCADFEAELAKTKAKLLAKMESSLPQDVKEVIAKLKPLVAEVQCHGTHIAKFLSEADIDELVDSTIGTMRALVGDYRARVSECRQTKAKLEAAEAKVASLKRKLKRCAEQIDEKLDGPVHLGGGRKAEKMSDGKKAEMGENSQKKTSQQIGEQQKNAQQSGCNDETHQSDETNSNNGTAEVSTSAASIGASVILWSDQDLIDLGLSVNADGSPVVDGLDLLMTDLNLN